MGTTPVMYEGRLQGQPALDYFLPHSMIVNRHGKRFVNEKQMNVGLAFAERDPETGTPLHLPAWRIYDAQFASKIRTPCQARISTAIISKRTPWPIWRRRSMSIRLHLRKRPSDSAPSPRQVSTKTLVAAVMLGTGIGAAIPIISRTRHLERFRSRLSTRCRSRRASSVRKAVRERTRRHRCCAPTDPSSKGYMPPEM